MLVDYKKGVLAVIIAAIFSFLGFQTEISAADYEHKLFFASDYQGDPAPENLEVITAAIEEEGITPELAVWCGDYTNEAGWEDANEALTEISANVKHIKNTMTDIWSDMDYLFLQGNHDNTSFVTDGTLTPTGPVEYDDYIIYIINMDDFPWAQGVNNDFSVASVNKSRVQKTAQNLKTYLNSLIEDDETRPVIMLPMSHCTGRQELQTGVMDGWITCMPKWYLTW